MYAPLYTFCFSRHILYVQEVVTHFIWLVNIENGSLLLGHTVDRKQEYVTQYSLLRRLFPTPISASEVFSIKYICTCVLIPYRSFWEKKDVKKMYQEFRIRIKIYWIRRIIRIRTLKKKFFICSALFC